MGECARRRAQKSVRTAAESDRRNSRRVDPSITAACFTVSARQPRTCLGVTGGLAGSCASLVCTCCDSDELLNMSSVMIACDDVSREDSSPTPSRPLAVPMPEDLAERARCQRSVSKTARGGNGNCPLWIEPLEEALAPPSQNENTCPFPLHCVTL